MKHVKGISIPKMAVCTLDPTCTCPCGNGENKIGGDLFTLILLPLLSGILGKDITNPDVDC